jgi:hypothetical protein
LKTDLGASVLQRRKESRHSPRVGTLRTLKLRRAAFLLADHVGPQKRNSLSGEFLDKMSGKSRQRA